MRNTRSRLAVWALAAAVLACVQSLPGPVQGTIKGMVKDKKGNPVEGAKVTIVSIQYSAVKYTLKSNAKGEYIQIGLQPDYYQIKAEKDGFLPAFTEKHVGIMEIVEVVLELEEGKYFIGESPGDKDFKSGNELFVAGKFPEAVEAYKAAIQKEPGEPVYHNNLGLSYLRLGKSDEALEAFRKMLEIQPESYSANKNIGEILGAKQMYQEALPYFQKASEVSTSDPDASYNLGACLVNLQDYERAAAAFTRAAELKPDLAPAYYQLGMIYVNQNKKPEAIQNLEKFLTLAPDDPKAGVARQILAFLKTQ